MAVSGDMAEGAVGYALLARGCVVLHRTVKDTPYDLVVDRGCAGLARIQVKTAWERDGCVHFNGSSTDHGKGHRHYRGRVEYFGVYLPPRERVFIVPVEQALSPAAADGEPSGAGDPLAEDFALERYLDRLRPAPAALEAAG